jgi:carbon monoxide dehydrogenase subunit G
MKLQFTVQKDIEIVWNYLTKMHLFVTVHPVITKMKQTAVNTYLVSETLEFGPFNYAFNYPVTVEPSEEHKQIVMKATVQKITSITMNFTLIQNGNITTIEEEICIKTPLPVKVLIQKIFREQHAQLFRNIESKEYSLS